MKKPDTDVVNIRMPRRLRKLLKENARKRRETVSQFVREAIVLRCNESAQPSTRERLSYVIGAISSGTKNTMSHKEEFAQIMREKYPNNSK